MTNLTQTIMNLADYETSQRLGLRPAIEMRAIDLLMEEQGCTYQAIDEVLSANNTIIND